MIERRNTLISGTSIDQLLSSCGNMLGVVEIVSLRSLKMQIGTCLQGVSRNRPSDFPTLELIRAYPWILQCTKRQEANKYP